MKLPLCKPFCSSMYRATCRFSTPWSPRTLDGNPKVTAPLLNRFRTVSALLLFSHFKYMIRRLQPSMQPWKTNRQAMSLWLLSMCLKEKKYYACSQITLQIYFQMFLFWCGPINFYCEWINWLLLPVQKSREMGKIRKFETLLFCANEKKFSFWWIEKQFVQVRPGEIVIESRDKCFKR